MDYSGKKILIIGGSSNIMIDEYPDYYDLIVRINRGYPVKGEIKKLTSGRCDVLYIYFSINPHKDWKRLPELRVRLNDRRFDRPYTVKNKFGKYNDNISIIEKNFISSTNKKVGCKVNTGILAISEILEYDFDELHITGFSFYKKNFHDDYPEGSIRKRMVMKHKGDVFEHNQEKQLEYFVENVFILDNVSCDYELTEICEDYLNKQY